MNIQRKLSRFLSAFFILSMAVIACGFPASEPTQEPAATLAPTELPSPTPTPAPRNLTVCLGQEPNTLYPFGGPNAAARSVLAAIYDGPVDMVGYEYQPVILTQLPSLANGDAQIVSTQVQSGEQVVDAAGNVVLLEQGVKVRPSSCRTDDCVIQYDGTTALQMDQMLVTFRMRPDLVWSDGTPVTSDDSVYAYTIASDANAIADTYLIDRTLTYEATDAQTVQWWGRPGFIDTSYFMNFWQPAPRHIWSQFAAGQLPTVDASSRSPMGWGPYMVESWIANDHITLAKNPYYFRTADGYPKFDTVTFRFIADPNTALSELVAGRCDILDPSIHLDAHVGLLDEMQKGQQAKAFMVPGMTIEWLGFGITPASYDNGYDTLFQKDRADIFSDPHTRQGIAYCLDRQTVVDQVLFGYTTVPATYLPSAHPLYDPTIQPLPHDPAQGIALLEQAGWRDDDGNPATPRIAIGIKGIPPNTPLLLNYYTTTATQRRQAVDILSKSLAECGVGLNVQYLAQSDLYASGPSGVLFGRNFDLAQYAMGVNGIEPPCDWFTTNEIPTANNAWVGTNVTGFKNEQYDAACRAAQLALPDDPTYKTSYQQTEAILSTELPAIPLYYRLRVSAARPDICHYDLDATANPLWNIEAIDMGEACKN